MREQAFFWVIISFLSAIVAGIYYAVYSLIVYGLTLFGVNVGIIWPLVILFALLWIAGTIQIMLFVYAMFKD